MNNTPAFSSNSEIMMFQSFEMPQADLSGFEISTETFAQELGTMLTNVAQDIAVTAAEPNFEKINEQPVLETPYIRPPAQKPALMPPKTEQEPAPIAQEPEPISDIDFTPDVIPNPSRDMTAVKNDKILKQAQNDTKEKPVSEVPPIVQVVQVVQEYKYENHPTVGFTDFKYGASEVIETIKDLTDTKTEVNVWEDPAIAMVLPDEITVVEEIEIKIEYPVIKMSDEDAVFFADLVQKSVDTIAPVYTIVTQVQQAMNSEVEQIQQPAQISATLLNAIQDAVKNNQPLRIEFDKDVSVIIKVNKDGGIDAKFLPGDKAVEQYLRNNIPFLQQRFESQNIHYHELSYSSAKQQQRDRRERNRRDK